MRFVAKLSGFAALLMLTVAVLPVPATAYQPPLPMLLNGFVYIDGVKPEDGTLVEAEIDGVTVASCRTETFEGQKGRYVLPSFQGSPGDEVHLFVEGVRAKILVQEEEGQLEPKDNPVEYEGGRQTFYLKVGEEEPPTHTLTMIIIGSGQTVPPVGADAQLAGSVVTIRAIPDEGWKFYGWIGDVADPNLAATWIIMDSDKTVTANFAVPTPTPTATSTPSPGPRPTATVPSEEPTPTPPTEVVTAAAEQPTPTPPTTAAEEPTPTTAAAAAAAAAEQLTPPTEATATAISEAPSPAATPAATSTERQSGGNRTWLLVAVGLTGVAGIGLGVLLRKLGAKGQ